MPYDSYGPPPSAPGDHYAGPPAQMDDRYSSGPDGYNRGGYNRGRARGRGRGRGRGGENLVAYRFGNNQNKRLQHLYIFFINDICVFSRGYSLFILFICLHRELFFIIFAVLAI